MCAFGVRYHILYTLVVSTSVSISTGIINVLTSGMSAIPISSSMSTSQMSLCRRSLSRCCLSSSATGVFRCDLSYVEFSRHLRSPGYLCRIYSCECDVGDSYFPAAARNVSGVSYTRVVRISVLMSMRESSVSIIVIVGFYDDVVGLSLERSVWLVLLVALG